MKKKAIILWNLLDDIDTVSDITKGDDKGYRFTVELLVARRFEVFTSDGYGLFDAETGDKVD